MAIFLILCSLTVMEGTNVAGKLACSQFFARYKGLANMHITPVSRHRRFSKIFEEVPKQFHSDITWATMTAMREYGER